MLKTLSLYVVSFNCLSIFYCPWIWSAYLFLSFAVLPSCILNVSQMQSFWPLMCTSFLSVRSVQCIFLFSMNVYENGYSWESFDHIVFSVHWNLTDRPVQITWEAQKWTISITSEPSEGRAVRPSKTFPPARRSISTSAETAGPQCPAQWRLRWGRRCWSFLISKIRKVSTVPAWCPR